MEVGEEEKKDVLLFFEEWEEKKLKFFFELWIRDLILNSSIENSIEFFNHLTDIKSSKLVQLIKNVSEYERLMGKSEVREFNKIHEFIVKKSNENFGGDSESYLFDVFRTSITKIKDEVVSIIYADLETEMMEYFRISILNWYPYLQNVGIMPFVSEFKYEQFTLDVWDEHNPTVITLLIDVGEIIKRSSLLAQKFYLIALTQNWLKTERTATTDEFDWVIDFYRWFYLKHLSLDNLSLDSPDFFVEPAFKDKLVQWLRTLIFKIEILQEKIMSRNLPKFSTRQNPKRFN